MQQNIQNKLRWSYLAGFYDGEGTIGFRVVKEKRPSRTLNDTEGWYLTPYLQIANIHKPTMEKIQKFLQSQQIISHLIPQNYGKNREKN